MKRVADADLEPGTLERTDFGLGEQTIAMSDTEQPLEATFVLRVVGEPKNVEGGTATYVQMPHRERTSEAWGIGWETINELEVQREQLEIISDTHFDIRPKSQPFDQLAGFEMHAAVELIGFSARPDPHPESLSTSGGGEQRERNHSRDLQDELHLHTPLRQSSRTI